MSEARLISPMLDGFALGSSISEHHGVQCYPAMRSDSDEHYIVKTISIPASQVQAEALLLTGAFADNASVQRYYQELASGIGDEVEILEKLSKQRGFLPYQKFQIVPKETGIGFDVYLLSHYGQTLQQYLKHAPMTHLSAINMGIDLCAAMVVCREAGYLYVDLKPGNIFLQGHQEYRIGDIGFIRLGSLKYASLPDRCRSAYTPPEISDAYATLNTTMDTYALGLILYQVYNNGRLPFENEAEREALMEKLAAGESLPAPAYADYEMAQIIEKACSYYPENRWADPVEMGHALIGYMQRNGANDVPIVPPVVAEPEPVEEPEEELSDTPVDETPAEESADETPVEEEAEAPVEDADDDTPDEDWIDQAEALLAEDGGEAEDADEDAPTLRQLLEGDDADEDDAEDVSVEELSDDTAGMLTHVEELVSHEAPEPVVAPEPIDVPIPEPIVLKDETPEDADETPDETPAEDAAEAPEEAPAEEEAEDPLVELYEDPEPKTSGLKKVIGILAALITAAAIGIGAWYFYQNYYLQTIDRMQVTGKENQLTVVVESAMDHSLLTVVCKDTYGNPLTGKLENGSVTFADLLPGTQYIISLEVEGFHELVGAAPATYYTPAETKLLNLSAVTGQENGSAIISFGVEGADSTEWTLHCTTEGEQTRSIAFTGHTVAVNGLTVGKTYTFLLEGTEEIYLVGDNAILHTVSNLITAENLTVSSGDDGSMTATWTAPEGASVDKWIVRCYNEDGYDQMVEVTETTATFTGISKEAAYTLEVTASGMTLGTRTFVTANPITITDVTAEVQDGVIRLNWTFDGQAPASGWLVLYSADGGVVQQVVNTDTPSAELTLAAPGCHYDILIQTPDATSIFGGTVSVDVPDSGAFDAYGLDTTEISVTTYAVPQEENWDSRDLRDADTVSTFPAGGSMALLYYTRYRYSTADDALVTLFVIRDAEGKLVSVGSNTRPWSDMWSNGYCTETVSNLPTQPGSYTLTVYVDGMKLTIQNFTIE